MVIGLHRILCSLGLHHWGEYMYINPRVSGRLRGATSESSLIGDAEVRCSVCGKRKKGIPNQVWSHW